MCTNNRDGELPSCLTAKYDGPGCEEWDLCYQCADTLKAEKDRLLLQNDEMATSMNVLMGVKDSVVEQRDDLKAQLNEARSILGSWNGKGLTHVSALKKLCDLLLTEKWI